MSIVPSHWAWARLRPACHGEARRDYLNSTITMVPRGPGRSPRYCAMCSLPEEPYGAPFNVDVSLYRSSSSGDEDTSTNHIIPPISKNSTTRKAAAQGILHVV